jgi:hypothetical protein
VTPTCRNHRGSRLLWPKDSMLLDEVSEFTNLKYGYLGMGQNLVLLICLGE